VNNSDNSAGFSASREQVRRLDARCVSDYGLSSLVLMENAGRGVADLLCRLIQDSGPEPGGPSVICCGRGNNGGDGFVAARHLDLRRLPVEVLLFAEPASLTGDAAVNFRVLEKCGVPIRVFAGQPVMAELAVALANGDWIVDALLGTGSHGDPRPPLDQIIGAINAAGKPILAVDLPSGLDCDTGQAGHPTVRAPYTCTFVAAKRGFSAPAADEYTGQVHIADIGAPRKLVDEILGEILGEILAEPPSPQR
jgi:NAD(P)H-hydrate epimerase